MRPMGGVRTHHGRVSQWILWQSWQVWRFGQRAPELIGFRVVEDLHHRTNFPSTLVDE